MSTRKITIGELADSVIQLIQNSGGAVKSFRNTVTINTNTNTINIGIAQYNKDTDILMIFKNTTYIEQGSEYNISTDSLSITKITGTWDGSADSIEFNFIVLKNVPIGTNLNGNIFADGTIDMNKLATAVQDQINNNTSSLADITINAKQMSGANDKEKIQNALNTGLNVYIPYNWHTSINDYLTVTTAGQKIFGLGSITQTTMKKCIFLVTANNVEIRDITFNGVDGDSSNLPVSYASAVIAKQVSNVRVINCKINNCSATFGAGIWFTSSNNCIAEKNIINSCSIGINTDDFYSTGSNNNKIDKNIITACERGYVLDLQGINCNTSKGDVVTNNTITNCQSDGATIDYAGNGFSLQNNILSSNGGNGLSIVHGTTKGQVIGNKINNNSLIGIVINGIDANVPNHIKISCNDIHDNIQDGIQLYTVENIKINSNDIFNNGRCGILNVSNSYPRHIKIIDNNITYNVNDGIYFVDGFDISIAYNSIYSNSKTTSNTYSGITIAKVNFVPINIIFSHNIFFNDNTGYVETQKYAINITANSYTNLASLYNAFGTQVTASISDATGGLFSASLTGMKYLQQIGLSPIPSTTAINYSIFLNSSNGNALSYKDGTGTIKTITLT